MQNTVSNKILSDITVYMKYARYISNKKRRENWFEIVTRNKEMHIKKYPTLKEEIEKAYEFVYDKKVLPSMRSLQFAGKPIEISPSRIYNCAFMPADSWEVFHETMFLLLGGTGVGFSVQKHHVKKLPEIKKVGKPKRYLVADSIEGWADAVKILMKAYMFGDFLPKYDFSDIRPKGALLVTSGGKAPGAQPLIDCLHNIKKILDTVPVGEKLKPIQVHDIMCFIADAVLAGGIRRAALISLFSYDDNDMLTCKFGSWWELNPQRARANNSVVMLRHRVKKEDFQDLWKKVELSKSGEPGIFFSNDKEWGTNPSLRAGTKVLTTNGIFPIEQLENKEFEVKNLNGEISKAKCWLSGKNKQLYKITLAGNHVYYSTPEHEWPIWDGQNYIKIKTSELSIGDYLPILRENSLFNGGVGTYDDGFFIGWHLGDGWTSIRKNGDLQHGMIISENESNDIKPILEQYLRINLNSDATFHLRNNDTYELNTILNSWNILQEKFKYSKKTNGLPKLVWENGSETFRKGLIDGLFSSDGNVSDNRITFTSAHEKLASDVSELLGFYGIKNVIKKSISILNGKEFTRFDVIIKEKHSIIHFKSIFKLSNCKKQEKLNKIEYNYNIIDKKQIEIIDIELSEIKEDVWDISVFDSTHCFQVAHCVTGNCAEISLRANQFCNLTEINAGDIVDQEDFNARAKAAALIGTLQASYTDFHYLRDIWKETTEREALIGVGITGIGSGTLDNLDLKTASKIVLEENKRISKIIGINSAARTTTVKPSGCMDENTIIKTSKGNFSLKEIFDMNGYNLEDYKNTESIFLPPTEKMYVYDMNNDLQEITNLYVNGVSDMMEIEFEDGVVIKCTKNHMFLTTNRGWVRADELKNTDDVKKF